MATTATRLLVVLVLAAGALATAMLACPEKLTGLRPGSERVAATTLVANADDRASMLRERIELRAAATRQLVAGEMTLLEAASSFRRMNETPRRIADHSWKCLPGKSDGEKVCRQVLRWAELELASSATPIEARLRMEALEAELTRAIGTDGAIALP